MPDWVIHALLAAAAAGFTSVIAKLGLAGIPGELGLMVRTGFVAALVMAYGAAFVPREAFGLLRPAHWAWLGLSGVTTAISWVFYYKALKAGDVSTVALIDKGSVLVALPLAWLVLREQFTLRTLLGAALVAAGLWVLSRRG